MESRYAVDHAYIGRMKTEIADNLFAFMSAWYPFILLFHNLSILLLFDAKVNSSLKLL